MVSHNLQIQHLQLVLVKISDAPAYKRRAARSVRGSDRGMALLQETVLKYLHLALIVSIGTRILHGQETGTDILPFVTPSTSSRS